MVILHPCLRRPLERGSIRQLRQKLVDELGADQRLA